MGRAWDNSGVSSGVETVQAVRELRGTPLVDLRVSMEQFSMVFNNG